MEERKTLKKKEIPLDQKYALSLEEASKYFGIGRDKLRELTNPDDCDFVLWIGSKRLIKREKFAKYLDNQYSV